MKNKDGMLIPVHKEYCVKIFFRCFLLSLLSILLLSIQLPAQEIKKSSQSVQLPKITLRVKEINNNQTVETLKNALKDCGKKIINYSIDKSSQTVSVVISEKLQPLDLLEVLASHGIHAGYLNEKNEYITLDEEGELAEPINITK